MTAFVLTAAAFAIPAGWFSHLFMLLYLGPETVMPLASAIAAVLGFVLIFWRFIMSSVKKMFRAVTGRPAAQSSEIQDTADETKDELPSL
jgi:hypothetical protein